MSKKRGLKSRWDDRPDLDCTTCWQRKTCERAEEGTFCSRWARTEPEPQGTDPNALWRTGEDVEFEG